MTLSIIADRALPIGRDVGACDTSSTDDRHPTEEHGPTVRPGEAASFQNLTCVSSLVAATAYTLLSWLAISISKSGCPIVWPSLRHEARRSISSAGTPLFVPGCGIQIWPQLNEAELLWSFTLSCFLKHCCEIGLLFLSSACASALWGRNWAAKSVLHLLGQSGK